MALRLAHALNAAGRGAVIVNADASQVYRDLRILTARPSVADEAAAPHRLYGTVDGAVAMNAAAWAAAARDALQQAWAAGAIPILVGGTGLYLRTLIDGIAAVPAVPDAIRADVRALPLGEAVARLHRADPEAAARLHPNDDTRIRRALEVAEGTGRLLSAWQRTGQQGIGGDVAITGAILLPPRDALRARCDARAATMLDDGAVDEVAALVARRLDPALPVMRAIGVADIAAMLDGTIDRATALDRLQAATRQYVKRQTTWFRNQPPPDWQRHEQSINDDFIDEIVTKLRNGVLTG